MTAGVVYQNDCKYCSKNYIGETGKTLEERLINTRQRNEIKTLNTKHTSIVDMKIIN